MALLSWRDKQIKNFNLLSNRSTSNLTTTHFVLKHKSWKQSRITFMKNADQEFRSTEKKALTEVHQSQKPKSLWSKGWKMLINSVTGFAWLLLACCLLNGCVNLFSRLLWTTMSLTGLPYTNTFLGLPCSVETWPACPHCPPGWGLGRLRKGPGPSCGRASRVVTGQGLRAPPPKTGLDR